MHIDGGSISKASLELSNDFATQAPAGSAGLTFVPPNDGVDPGDGEVDQIFESKKKPNNAGASTTLTCGEGTTLTMSSQGNTGTMTCEPNEKPKPKEKPRQSPDGTPILD
jgi:hypothetical protein